MINDRTLQARFEEFQFAVSDLRESIGVVGGDTGSNSSIPDTSEAQDRLYEMLTTAAIKGQIRFSSGTESVIVNKVLRIEHQSYLRGEAPNKSTVVVNLMDYDTVEMV